VELRVDSLLDTYNLFQRLRVLDTDGNELAWNKRSIKYNKKGDAYGYVRIPLVKNLEPGKDYRLVLDMDIADTAAIHLPAQRVINFTGVDAGADKPGMTVVEPFESADGYKAWIYVYSIDTHYLPVATSTERLFGDTSLQLTYDFNDKSSVLISYENRHDVSFSKGDTLGLHVWGDMGFHRLEVMLDKDNVSGARLPIDTIDFHGWRYLEIPLDDLEEGNYKFAGFMLHRNNQLMGNTGIIRFDNLLKKASSGIDELQVAGMQVRVAGDYIVVSADTWVQGVELIDIQGRTIKATSGNCLNVADVERGIYVVRVHINGSTSSQKIRL